jgi:hypothetical protein
MKQQFLVTERYSSHETAVSRNRKYIQPMKQQFLVTERYSTHETAVSRNRKDIQLMKQQFLVTERYSTHETAISLNTHNSLNRDSRITRQLDYKHTFLKMFFHKTFASFYIFVKT